MLSLSSPTIFTAYPPVPPILGPRSIPKVSTMVDFLARHAYTAILFTWSDFKTIFLPITVFGCATAPVQSLAHLAQGYVWIWLHLLLCNISNQASSKAEDLINRPWRPLPSGRVTEQQMKLLRVFMAILCTSWSGMVYGYAIASITIGLVLTTFAYDEMGLASHPAGKSFCNVWGYLSFETAVIRLMGPNLSFDKISRTAVCLSTMIIFSTIHAQDFPDIEGDSAEGRITLPIYAPEFSRLLILLLIPLWSLGLSMYWGIGQYSASAFVIFGLTLGFRFYGWRNTRSDKRSYMLFNVWLSFVAILPLHARSGVFSV